MMATSSGATHAYEWRHARRVALAAAALVALSPLAAALEAKAETPDSDPRAVRIADQVIAALGGKARWESMPCLAWTFETARGDTLQPGARRHLWDRASGWHRVEGQNRQGQRYVIIHQLDRPGGKAWVNGTGIQGDSLAKLLKRAKSLWINDTYWMLMPYKLRDPGVRLKYVGQKAEGGVTYDELALSFEKVGETPGDRYWVFVNRASHRIEKWEMVLQDMKPPPRVYTWAGYEEHGGLWFPTVHRSGAQAVYTRAIEVMKEFPAKAFASP